MQHVVMEVFILLVLEYIGQPGSKKKKYSLIIGCNNFITNQKLSGEFLHPMPTRFDRGFFKVLKPYGNLEGFDTSYEIYVIYIPVELLY